MMNDDYMRINGIYDYIMHEFRRGGGAMDFIEPGIPYIIHKQNVIPPIRKIIFNPPATIVFWNDGEKTVVKCKESEEFDCECGLAFAVAKRYFGSRSKFKKAIGDAEKITSDLDSGIPEWVKNIFMKG